MPTTRTVSARADLGRLPLPLLVAVCAAATGGVIGGLVGLVLGLVSYPPTAWFAVLEVGVPAALLGFVLGLLGGAVAARLRRHARLVD